MPKQTLMDDRLLARQLIGERYGSSYDNKRDVLGELGRAKCITPAMYRERYRRGGIARRIVRIIPNWVWRGRNEFMITGGRQAALDLFIRRFWVNRLLRKVHLFSDLTGYAGVLMEGDGGGLDSPPSGLVTGYSVWGADCLVIEDYDDNTGLPTEYTLKRTQRDDESIHPARVIHYANGDLDSDLHGEPVLEPAWDVLDDLDKTFGSMAEAIWLAAVPDLHADIPPKDLSDIGPDEIDLLDEQLQNYRHHLSRVIRTVDGTTINRLAGDSPTGVDRFIDSAFTMLSAIYGIPKRILSGSERGELASTQDRLNWQEHVDELRAEVAIPMANFVIHPLAEAAGIDLRQDNGEDMMPLSIDIEWEHWETNRAPDEWTLWLHRQCMAIHTAVEDGTLAREVAVRLYPEQWFGPPEERYPTVNDDDPLGDSADDFDDDDSGSDDDVVDGRTIR